jgi:hypothetical protein
MARSLLGALIVLLHRRRWGRLETCGNRSTKSY